MTLNMFSISSILIFSILFFTACGGSSSRTDANGQTIIEQGEMTIATSTINMKTLESYHEPVISKAVVNVSQSIKNEIANGKVIYFVLSQTNGSIANILAKINTNSGELVITTPANNDISVGQHSSVITVRGCWDRSCNNEFGQVKVNYTLDVYERPAISATELSIDVTRQEDIESQTLLVNANGYSFKSNIINIDASYSYYPSDWMAVTNKVVNSEVTFDVAFSKLQCGSYQSELSIQITTEFDQIQTFEIPVEYNISSSTPIIDDAYPRVHYLDEPIQLSLWGCGFEQAASGEISFDGINVMKINVLNDRHVNIVASPIDTEGQHAVSLSNSNEISKVIPLNLAASITRQSQEIAKFRDFGWILGGVTIELDDFNDRIFVREFENGKTVMQAYELQGDSYVRISDIPFSEAVDIDIANDGERYYVAFEDRIDQVSVSTFEILQSHNYSPNYTGHSTGKISDIQPMLDGAVMMRLVDPRSQEVFVVYTPETGNFAALKNSVISPISKSRAIASRDRSTIMVAVEEVSNTFVSTFSLSEKRFSKGVIAGDNRNGDAVFKMSTNWNGTLSLIDSRHIINNNMEIQFTLPYSLNGLGGMRWAKVNYTGDKAYSLYKNSLDTSSLVEFDLDATLDSNESPYRILGEFPQGIFNDINTQQLYLSGDQNTLFLYERSLLSFDLQQFN